VTSLGYFFIDGFQRDFPLEILVGIIGTVVIAVVFDLVLALIGRLLLPWTSRTVGRRRGRAAERTQLAGAA
jgi:osmoprotectant transport system permease protein